jgi:hypothetical protein
MIIKYDILFEVDVRHGFYTSGFSHDFVIEPTNESAELLNRYGLIWRSSENGFKVYAPVVPDTNPPQLARPLDGASLKFSFLVSIANKSLENITHLPDYDPNRSIYYFSNLQEDIDGDIRFLGDHIANSRIAAPVEAIKTPILNYKFDNPVSEAEFTLTDMFGIEYTPEHPQFNYDEQTLAFQHNLGKIAGMKSGRYIMTDNQGGSLPFYFSRDLYGKDVFGIIEIFTNTTKFTDPEIDLVPVNYRFVDNDQITGQGHYSLGLTAAQQKWMYVCRKNPANAGNGFEVNNLTVQGPVAFNNAGGDDVDERLILSDDPIALSEMPANVELRHSGIKIIDLPVPSASSRLAQQNNESFYQMYIYV